MIRFSDNDAADAISARVGMAGLSDVGRRAGMRHFFPYPSWGGSTITAVDQARFFLRVDRLVPRRHRAYAVGLLRNITESQRWGIAAAAPRGWRIAFKGGWGRGVTREVNHQAALLTNAGLRVSVAVMTADNPSHEYGTATQQGVAARLLRGLAGTVRAELLRSRQRLGRGASAQSSAGSIRRATMTAKAMTIGGIPLSLSMRRCMPAPFPGRMAAMTGTHRILLFDIDGTLVSTGGAGAVAWRRAFEDLHGIPADIGKFTDAGMTDPDVGAKTFEAVLGRKPSAHELAQIVQRRLEHLPEAVAESEGYKVLPGVPERLRQLSREGHLLGLITGNGDGAAFIKLSRGDLMRWFTFGAYASAGVDRPGIVRQAVSAARRCSARTSRTPQIYVIGDTPLDISAAHAVDCTAIAVATGHYDAVALREAGADHVLETLEEELPLA